MRQPHEHEQLRERLEVLSASGLTQREIAARLGKKPSTIGGYYRDYGITPGWRAKAERRWLAKYGGTRGLARLEKRLTAGDTHQDIGEEFGVSREMVRQWTQWLLPHLPPRRKEGTP